MNNNYYRYQNNYPSYNNSNDERLIGGGFLGPFVLGGITGGLVAPYFYGGYNRPQAYYYQPGPRPPYYGRPPFYGPGPGFGPRPF